MACDSIFPYKVHPFYLSDEKMMMTEYNKCKNDAGHYNKYQAICEGLVYQAYAKVQGCKQAEEIKNIKSAAPVIQQQITSKVDQNTTLNYVLGGVALVAVITAIAVYSISD